MIGVLGVGALSAGIVWRTLPSTRGTGHTQRLVGLATAALDPDFPVCAHEAGANGGRTPRHIAYVEVDEGSGRPSLVSIDIVVVSSDALSRHKAAAHALNAVIRAAWNNPEMALVSVHARVPLAHGEAGDLEASDVQIDTVVDMNALGFADETARPDELYDCYGAPECGPA